MFVSRNYNVSIYIRVVIQDFLSQNKKPLATSNKLGIFVFGDMGHFYRYINFLSLSVILDIVINYIISNNRSLFDLQYILIEVETLAALNCGITVDVNDGQSRSYK